MGMAVENLGLRIEAQTTGEEQARRLEAAIGALITKVEGVGKATKEVGASKPFEGFAQHVKDAIQHPLDAAGNAAQGLLTKLGPIGTAVTGTVAVLTAAATAGFMAAKSLGEYGDSIADTAVRTGLSTKEVGQFSFALKRVGGDITQLEGIMRKLSQALVEKPEEFQKLGIRIRELDGSFRPTSQIILEVSERLAAMPSSFDRNTEAVKLMGRGALEGLPKLLEMAEGYKRAQDLNIGKTEEEVKQLLEYQKQINELEMAWGRLVKALKQPAAAVFSFVIRQATPGGSVDVGEMTTTDWLVQAVTQKMGLGGLVGVTDLRGAALSKAQEEITKRIAFGAGTAPIRASIERDLNSSQKGLELNYAKAQEKAKEAYKAYSEYAGADPAAAAKLRKAWEADDKSAAGLKARIDSITEALRKTKQEAESLKTAMEGLGKRGEESWASGDELQKIIADRAEFIKKFPKADLAEVNARFGEIFSNKHVEVADKLSDALEKIGYRMGDIARERGGAIRLMGGMLLPLSETAGLSKDLLDKFSAKPVSGYELSRIGGTALADNSELLKSLDKVSEKIAQRTAAMGTGLQAATYQAARASIESEARADMQRVSLTAGPGFERLALNYEWDRKNQLARDLFELEKQRIAVELDGQKRIVMQVEANLQLKRAERDAELEHENKLLELARRRQEQFRSNIVGGFDALISGGAGGLQSFAKSFAIGQLRSVVGNTADMVYKNVGSSLSLPGTGTDTAPTKLGQLLTGTLFGPKTDANARAVDLNTFATIENTRALQTFGGAAGGGAAGGAGSIGGSVLNLGKYFGLFAGGGTTADGRNPREVDAWGSDVSPDFTAGSGWGRGARLSSTVKGIGYAGGVAAGAFGVYSGLKAGGPQGITTAIGSGLGAAAMIPGPQQPFIMAGAMAAGLVALMLGDPKKKRGEELARGAESRRVDEPVGANYFTDTYGRSVDYDYRGGMRTYQTINISATNNINALDTANFEQYLKDNPTALAVGMTAAMNGGNAEDVVGTIRNML